MDLSLTSKTVNTKQDQTQYNGEPGESLVIYL